MIVKQVHFFGSAVSTSQYPADGLPEIVLCGRSNVGKSSFINTMLNQRKIARVSGTPGKTRLINFFRVNEAFYFVDIPGYGYAQVSQGEQEAFRERIEMYLSRRPTLRAAVLLLDLRRIPNADDHSLIDYIRARGIPLYFVLTKADKLSNNERFRQIRAIYSALPEIEPSAFHVFSSVTKENVDGVWAALEPRLFPGSATSAKEDPHERP
ncbi:MAG TPA: ribosome biogenesis GTP-binding protein YihA/YsxC [Candidatus Izemoplasmatales bacterium]|nr:ribosome biogenesis GTP-binding protein YihA/YsxC [Candidatus Izemoplasmatales bacterium]